VEAVGNQVIDTGCDNSLENFCALLSLSDIFLTPDSLGMHLSTALDKITLVLVGPTSPWEIDVFGKGEVIYSNNLDCISCYLSTCDKKINCMNSLSAESIFTILEKYIKDESRNH
jgi:ADP-heptose:LPS heptosyltransferase